MQSSKVDCKDSALFFILLYLIHFSKDVPMEHIEKWGFGKRRAGEVNRTKNLQNVHFERHVHAVQENKKKYGVRYLAKIPCDPVGI